MGTDGFWSIVYKGALRGGVGMLVLDAGTVVGADYAGSVYGGSYTYDKASDSFDIDMTITVPAGVRFAFDTPPRKGPRNVPIRISLPRDGDRTTTVTVDVADLLVDAEFRRIGEHAS